MLVESEEERQVENGDGDNDEPSQEPLQAVAHVFPSQELDDIRLPDVVDDSVVTVTPKRQ